MMDEEKVKKAIKASAAPKDFFRHASALGLFAPYRGSHLPRSDGFFEWLKERGLNPSRQDSVAVELKRTWDDNGGGYAAK